MARPKLYPEGGTVLHLYIPTAVKDGLQPVAQRQRRSVSQLVTVILEDYLRGERPVVAGGGQKEA